MNNDLTILIADDFATVRKVIRNLLKKIGYKNFFEADDGDSAMHILKSQRIDFIISDWNMPNMSGIELLKAVRADADLSKIPFLMITAETSKDNIVLAIKAGVSNYLVKPFTETTLKEKINQIMAKHGL